jgi:hypothetical protein
MQKAEDRRAAYNDMGKFYAARSKIVHGNKEQGMKGIAIERLEEFVRSSLKLYLKKKGNHESHDDIMCNIDFS